MKKKIVLLFALLTALLLLFAACATPNSSDYQKFNDMLKKSYSEVTVQISTTTETAELNGKFVLTFIAGYTKISYEFDRINTFDVDASGNVSDADDDFIVQENGSVVVRDGAIVDGDTTVELNLAQLDVTGFSFKSGFFKNVNLAGALFEADVTNPQRFTGSDEMKDCTDMHVKLIYNVSANLLTSIDLTYTSENGAAVKINYLFS